jgi:hypothetical protein
MTTASYYLWKWADNDLSGPPNEVFADLLRGKLHPALQQFDARPMIQALQAIVAERHALGEEWEWQIMPVATPGHAHAIFLQCPTIPKMGGYCKQFAGFAYKWSLSGYDEQRRTIIDCLVPKINDFVLGWGLDDAEEKLDISEADLPSLLRRLHPEHYNPQVMFFNRVNHNVSCLACDDGFVVEWRVNPPNSIADVINWDQWRAGYKLPPGKHSRYRIAREERVGRDWEWHAVRVRKYENERLRFDDVLLIFQAFLRSEPKPAQFQWRSLRKELEQAK